MDIHHASFADVIAAVAGVDWRHKLETQRGAVLATELKNNANKLAKWTAAALVSGVEIIKLGYVSRVHQRDTRHHVILGTQVGPMLPPPVCVCIYIYGYGHVGEHGFFVIVHSMALSSVLPCSKVFPLCFAGKNGFLVSNFSDNAAEQALPLLREIMVCHYRLNVCTDKLCCIR